MTAHTRFLVLVALVLAAVGLAGAASGARATATASSNLDAQLLAGVNQTRVAHGAKPLALSAALASAASGHTLEMGTDGYFGHTGKNGSNVGTRVKGSFATLGEDLVWASGNASPTQLLNLWLGNQAHRVILLSTRWTKVGISAQVFPHAPGVYGGSSVVIVTADFGR